MRTARPSALAIAAALAASAAAAQDAPGGAPAVAQAQNDWYVAGEGTVAEMLARQPNTGTARNVILFVADGNGPTMNYATRLYMGQRAGGLGEDFVLPYETFADTALVKTYTTNGQTPDSAPTATALNSGIKTKNDMINVGDSVAYEDCAAGAQSEVTTLADIAAGLGKSVGVVTTTRITHATPAAVYARTVNRDWESDADIPEGCDQPDIAAQLVAQMQSGVIDLALGGGRTMFLPEGTTGEEGTEGNRADGRNLIDEVTAMGGRYAWDQATFDALPAIGNGPVLGLFEGSHMQYELDREDEPSLAEMTQAAITSLAANDQGYYLMVEGGRVDHAEHAGNLERALGDGAAFAEAVQAAMDMTDEADTLIVVTADHGHGFALNGYCGRGSDITGLCMAVDEAGTANTGEPELSMDGKPYTVGGFMNGPGAVIRPEAEIDDDDATPLPAFSGSRPDLTEEEATDLDYLQQALIPMESETHSGDDVVAYARGPWSHLVGGVVEQNTIFHVMLAAMNGGRLAPAMPADEAMDAATDAAATGNAAADEGMAPEGTAGN